MPMGKQKVSVEVEGGLLGERKVYYIQFDISYKDEINKKECEIEYKMYRLDHLSQLDGVHQQMPAPILTLEKNKYADWVGFGALGSKIYMVGGWNHHKLVAVVDVYSFDTSLRFPTPTKEPPLKLPISEGPPVVIPAKGKLYVMPKSLATRCGGSPSVMQVFDPVDKSWSVIDFPKKMWDEGKRVQRRINLNPFGIEGYSVIDDLEISLSLNMRLGGYPFSFVYNTEDCEWRIRNATEKIAQFPLVERNYFMCDDILGSAYFQGGRMGFQDVTLGLGNEGEIILWLSELDCCKEYPRPYMEDARVMEIGDGYAVVVSRCWMKPRERWFQLRLHLLKFSFERRRRSSNSNGDESEPKRWSKRRKCNKARINQCQVLKCITLENDSLGQSDGGELPWELVYNVKNRKEFCFLI